MARSEPAHSWAKIVDAYRTPSGARGMLELAITVVPLASLWIVDWFIYSRGYWWASLLIAIPASGFLVRLFIIQHDCGHGAFFPNKLLNNWTGRIIGVVTMTPYDFWRRAHAIHHSTSGNLDRRGIGDIDLLTVDEYLALSRWGRFKYRLLRHPLVMFGVAPAFVFLILQRVPAGFMRTSWRPWLSTQANNIAIAASAALLMWFLEPGAVLFVYLSVMVLAATIGLWLFYVQHQFEHTYWANSDTWSLEAAALRGSTHYDLPGVLRWFTGNIGVHHVHHLCSRVPFYRLPDVLRDHPSLREMGRITFAESLRCINLKLWDERRQRLVSFQEAQLSQP